LRPHPAASHPAKAHSLGNTIVAHFVAWLRDGVGHPAADAWLARHVWGYIALSPPLLGAPGALRSVLSGESFGVPITEAQAREMQVRVLRCFYDYHAPTAATLAPAVAAAAPLAAGSYSRPRYFLLD